MALIFEFSEEYKESRGVNVSNDAFDQDFSFFIWGNFVESAEVDSTYGVDDDIVALEAAYSIIPLWRIMPMYDGNLILLTLNSLELKQLQTDHWKVTVRYGIPEMGGRLGGGYNQPVEPVVDNGTQWTNNFVQIGFDIRTETETRTQSLKLVAKDEAVTFPPPPALPYQIGVGAPMGAHNNGVEGTEVFVRTFEFNVTAYFTPQQLTYQYVRRLYRMAKTVNIKPFFGFPPGSVMFMGTGGQGDLFSVIPMTFNFVMRPNFILAFPPAFTFKEGPFNIESDNYLEMFDVIYDPFFPTIASYVVEWEKFDSTDKESPIYDPTAHTVVDGAGVTNVVSGWSTLDYRYGPEIPDPVTGGMYQEPLYRLIHMNYAYSDYKLLGI